MSSWKSQWAELIDALLMRRQIDWIRLKCVWPMTNWQLRAKRATQFDKFYPNLLALFFAVCLFVEINFDMQIMAANWATNCNLNVPPNVCGLIKIFYAAVCVRQAVSECSNRRISDRKRVNEWHVIQFPHLWALLIDF